MDKLVSVIVPAHNAQRYLKQTIDAILAQSYSNLEVIVVDDGSSDDTFCLAQAMAAADKRVCVLQNKCNIGVAEARNRGIEAAKGSLIAFCDADDLWVPDKLQKQVKVLLENQSLFSCTSYGFIDIDGKEWRPPYKIKEEITYRDLLRQNWIGLSSVVLDKRLLGEKRFSCTYFHEDYALWLELFRNGGVACGMPEVLMYHRQGGRSADKTNAARERWRIYRKMEGFSAVRSLYYCGHYFVNALRKYCR